MGPSSNENYPREPGVSARPAPAHGRPSSNDGGGSSERWWQRPRAVARDGKSVVIASGRRLMPAVSKG
jgi:hypothetical protein